VAVPDHAAERVERPLVALDADDIVPALGWFSESASRVLLSVAPHAVDRLLERARDAGVRAIDLGEAGGDRLVSADGRPVAGQEDWTGLLAARAPGDSIQLVFRQRGREVRAVLRLRADPRLGVRPAERAGVGFTEAQRAFRTAWLGSRARP